MKSEPKPKPLEVRVFSRVVKADNGCWIFTGFTDKDGYGWIRDTPTRQTRVHRFSLWYHVYRSVMPWDVFEALGRPPFNMCVLHSCDNPPCCNPEHLFWGTCKDNTQDMIKKGRRFNNKGDKHPMSKITEEQALEIYNMDGTLKNIAAKYGITFQMVWRIKHHKAWTHVTQKKEGISCPT